MLALGFPTSDKENSRAGLLALRCSEQDDWVRRKALQNNPETTVSAEKW